MAILAGEFVGFYYSSVIPRHYRDIFSDATAIYCYASRDRAVG